MKTEIVKYFQALQDSICSGLERLDGKAKFHEDLWSREGGGGGRTRVLAGGEVFEKGGVNFSEVFGKAPEFLSAGAAEFFASGVSIVIHPESPRVPIIHMNVRYLELSKGGSSERWWFGGGIDLTPIYVVEQDARNFHSAMKRCCDKHGENYYPKFRAWADDYFFIQHRNETRGIGGIFFDHLGQDGKEKKEDIFRFVQEVGHAFLPAYTPIVQSNRAKPYGEKERQWQRLRRGRYAEFNLVYDRGTKFGLETGGRTESILMSLPPVAGWTYDHRPDPGSEEARTLGFLKKDQNWVS